MELDLDKVKKQALEEMYQEDFAIKVAEMKIKLKKKKTLLDIIFPFKVIIIRKGDN